jgi:hypothetical protein
MKTLTILSFLLTASLSHAAITYELSCFNDEIYTDLGQASLALTTKVIVKGHNDYYLKNGFFKFFIEDAWTDQTVKITEVKNYKKYRPRVYTQHAKFPNISNDFNGKADLIIPHAALNEGKLHFTGIFILTWVEDHWGGTVDAECRLTPF